MSDVITPESRRLLDDLDRLCARARAALPALPVPCFAHLRVDSGGRTRDVLLGPHALTTPELAIVSWQEAPLASVFFSARSGEDYELEVGGRTLEGVVCARSLLGFAAGTLVSVETDDAAFVRRPGGPWLQRPQPSQPALGTRPRGAARAQAPWTREALDREQRHAVDLPPGRAVLVLGEAGCGKTTVALHRLAALRTRALTVGRPFRALVLVPAAGAGLRHLSESLLARLGISDAEVQVFDRWAAAQARRAFTGLPRRESRDAPAAVVRLKRHPALRLALERLVAKPPRRARNTGRSVRRDLLDLFGDRALLELAAGASDGAITAGTIDAVLEHTHVQFSLTTEAAHTHVDADRLVTVDGQLIDEGTPLGDAGTLDPEDYPVLFALAALRAAPGHRAPAPTAYDCIVLDEAQEFAPLELELVGRALRPGGSLIVAGDEVQQIDPSAYFAGWDGALSLLRATDCETVRLAVSYRCPPAVTALARTVRGGAPATTQPPPTSPPDDSAVLLVREANECHLIARLTDGLRRLTEADPAACIAVVCRTRESAARTARLLGRGLDVHLVSDGNFRFAPGIEVSCAPEVKGLEFDYAVLPDTSAAVYPDAGEARRALYVAMTRASQQLILACTGTPTPLLPGGGADAYSSSSSSLSSSVT